MPICRHLWILIASVIAASSAKAQTQHIAPTKPLKPAEQRKRFVLPPGFEIQLVAAEPDIGQPMNLNFDAAGRLWVTHSVEYPHPTKAKGVEPRPRGFEGVNDHPPRDRLSVLAGIGRAKKITHFVDGLNIPIGHTPVPGGAIVYSIPSIQRCIDSDGDGTAEKCETLYGAFGNIDTHGMSSSYVRWIDGWIYGAHGFRNTSKVKDGRGRVTTMRSGNTYRFREDGSRFEQFTWGQTNPFGLTFDPLGNLFSADCHSQPLYMLLRGASYPGIAASHRNDALPHGPTIIAHNHGSTGICGPAYYAAKHYPAKYRDSIFLCNPVTGRVHHDRYKVTGSTIRIDTQPDFVRCNDPWFRPVDAKVGPDGALYIADFYNAIIGHYEVPLKHPKRDRRRGRIWRIVYVGGKGERRKPPVLPDLTKLSLDKLIAQLGNDNLVVRTLATNEVIDRYGRKAIEPVTVAVKASASPTRRAHGLWVLARLGALDAELTKRLAADESRLVRVHLIKALAERKSWDPATAKLVVAALKDQDAFVRRAAADALGRHPRADNVAPLLSAWSRTPAADTHLVHTLRIALHDHLRDGKIANAVAGDIKPGHPLFGRLIAVHRTVQAEHSAAALFAELKRAKPQAGRLERDLYHAARYVNKEELSALTVWVMMRQSDWNDSQIVAAASGLLRALNERGESLSAKQRKAFAARLATIVKTAGRVPGQRRQRAVELLGGLRSKDSLPVLLKVAADPRAGFEIRRAAMNSAAALDPARTLPVLQKIVKNRKSNAKLRRAAVETWGRINTKTARKELVAVLATAPFEFAKPVARALASSRAGAEALLATIEKGKASRHLLREPAIAFAVQAAGAPNAGKRIAKLTAGLPTIDAQVEQLRRQRKAAFLRGDYSADLGKKVFTKTCAACHRVGGKGGKVGPDLDGIGIRGLDRVLEDVFTPSRNVDPAFRQSTIVTADGRIHTGLVTKEEGALLVLVNDEGKEERIPKKDVERRKLSSLSAMPVDIATKMKEPDVYHLLAYLLSLREKR